MARMTTVQKTNLNNIREAVRVVDLAGRIDNLEFGTTPSGVSGVVGRGLTTYTTTPVVGTAVYVHAAITLTSSTQTVTTSITNPDWPRIVTIKGNASGNAGNVTITGTDIAGAALTDTIALNGATEVLGVKAFKTVTSIALPAETHAGTDTCSIGVGNKVGFPVSIPNASLVVAKSFNLLVDSSTITVGTTAASSLAAPAGTFDGAKLYELTFIS